MTRLCLALLLVGCGPLDPDLGAPQEPPEQPANPNCAIVDSDPTVDVTFEMVREVVLRPECRCHVEAGGIGRTEGGLDLDDHQALLDGGRNSPRSAVIPGDPCESVLVQKLGDSPPFGARMPFRTFALAPEQQQLIIDWIAEGARP